MSKYDPLAAHLAGHVDAEWRASFADIEKVLGFALPKAARTPAWWKDGVWTGAGWTAEADPAAGAVSFRRISPASPPALADEPPILKRLDAGPGWGVALVLGGMAIVAGIGALAFRGMARRKT